MFKVLVISYYFPPLGLSGVQRTLKFVKYLPDNNWQPTVITTDSVGYYAFDYSLLEEIKDKNIVVHRIKGNEPNALLSKKGTITLPFEFIRRALSYISNLIFIPDNKVSWSKKALKFCSTLLTKEKFDIIFVSAPPFSSVSTAVELKNKFNIPLFIDYRDLWSDYHFAKFITPYHKHQAKKLEYKGLKASDKVIVINRVFKERLMSNYKFLGFKDVIIIPQGYDSADIENSTTTAKDTKRMVITYAGTFYENITPKYFLLAFKSLLKERPDIANNILLYFIGVKRRETKKLVRKLQLDNYVLEFGYLTHQETITKLKHSDALWLMIGNSANADSISTGKFYDYIGCRKPIIGCVPEGTLKHSLQEYKASFITKPDDIEAIKSTLIDVFKLYVNNQLPQPDESFIQKHERTFLTNELSKEFQFFLRDN